MKQIKLDLIKKFDFANEQRKMNQRALLMSMEDRRKYELENYQNLKDNNEKINQLDGSAMYYVVDGPWVNQWKAFIKEEGELPGEIDNSNLRHFILSYR